MNKINVEIWSDVVCPFCYIGKHKFEKALTEFKHKELVNITWRSYQLDPHLKINSKLSLNEYLSKIKGCSIDHAREMNDHVSMVARDAGLVFNIDHVIVANSNNAHRLIQLAKKYDIGGLAEEELFKAYFTNGSDISDVGTLISIGKNIGLSENALSKLTTDETLTIAIKEDINEAANLRIKGVPYFLFNRKFAVSGARDPDIFLLTLERTIQSAE
jgi:predicted DsbA family dithiol-disulfide isomerase